MPAKGAETKSKNKELTEYSPPKYYVRLWKSSTKFTTKSVKLYPDDTIAVVYAKLADQLGVKPGTLYAFCTAQRFNAVDMIIKNVFSEQRTIMDAETLEQMWNTLTGSNIKLGSAALTAAEFAAKIKSHLNVKLKLDNNYKVLKGDKRKAKLREAKLKAKKTEHERQLGTDATVPLGFSYRGLILPGNPLSDGITQSIKGTPANADIVFDTGLTLENYGPRDNTIDVVLASIDFDDNDISEHDRERILSWYFPAKLATFSAKTIPVKTIDTALHKVATQSVKDIEYNWQPNYLHIKVGKGLPESILDLNYLFAAMNPTPKVPYMKLFYHMRSTFKIHKPTIGFTPEIVKEWATMDMRKYNRATDSLIFRILVGQADNMTSEKYAVLQLFADGTYDIMLRLRQDETSDKTFLSNTFDYINVVLRTINTRLDSSSRLELVSPSVLIGNPDHKLYKTQQIAKFSFVCGLANKKAQPVDYAQLEKAARKLGSHFSIVRVDNTRLDMMYHRVDNFANAQNVMYYMQLARGLGKDGCVKLASDFFGISNDDAALYWERLPPVGTQVRSFKPLNFITLTVVHSVGYKAAIRGINDPHVMKRVLHALRVLVAEASVKKSNLAAAPAMPKIAVFDAEGADELLNNIKPAQNEIEKDADVDDMNMGFIMEDDDDEDIFPALGFGKAVDEAKTEEIPSKEDKTRKEDKSKNKKTDDDDDDAANMNIADIESKMKSKNEKELKKAISHYVLAKLMAADKKLFDFKATDKLTSYAKSCQKSDNRQPVVVSGAEMESISKKHPNSHTGSVAYGSNATLAKQNHYMCPQVWCPISRVPMTLDQFKKNGQKCPNPDIDETPVVFSKSVDVDRPRFVGFLKKKNHPDGLCLPCCFAKVQNDRKDFKTCQAPVSSKANDDPHIDMDNLKEQKEKVRYITQATSIPTDVGRYGLLPPNLAALFKEQVCGKHDDQSGNMTTDTNCYLRYGIPQPRQSFLQAMVFFLGWETTDTNTPYDIVKQINKNLSVEIFVSLNDGLVCRRFIKDDWDIQIPSLFRDFKDWMQANTSYMKTFELSLLLQKLKRMPVFTADDNDPLVPAAEIKRHFYIYSAYTSFLRYLADDAVIKTHEFLLDLFSRQLPWLNSKGINLLLAERNTHDSDPANQSDIHIICPKFAATPFNPNKPTFMVLKQYRFYEPIHHVKITNTSNMIVTKRHEAAHVNWAPLQQLYVNKCEMRKANIEVTRIMQNIENAGYKIKTQVIDIEFMLLGFIIDEPFMYLPLQQEVAGKALFKVQQPDKTIAFYEDIMMRAPFKVSESKAKKVLEAAGLDANLLNQIPLKPLTQRTPTDLINADIFSRMYKHDERTTLMDAQRLVNQLANATRNELVHAIKLPQHRDIYKSLLKLRDRTHTLPLQARRLILYSLLEPIIGTYVSTTSSNKRIEPRKDGKVCTIIGKRDDCTGHCAWKVVIGPKKHDVKGAKCKLSLPTNLYERLFHQTIETLINPMTPLSRVSTIHIPVTDDILVLTEEEATTQELGRILGALDRRHNVVKLIDVDAFTIHEVPVAEANTDLNILQKQPPPDSDGKQHDKVPTWARTPMNGFTVVNRDTFDPIYIYKVFEELHKKLVTTDDMPLSAEQLKEAVLKKTLKEIKNKNTTALGFLGHNPQYTEFTTRKNNPLTPTEAVQHEQYAPSEWELRLLAEIVKINVLVFARASRAPDQLFCVGKVKDKDDIVMFKLSNFKGKDHYELIVQHNTKFHLDLSDFSDAKWRDTLKKKIQVYKMT